MLWPAWILSDRTLCVFWSSFRSSRREFPVGGICRWPSIWVRRSRFWRWVCSWRWFTRTNGWKFWSFRRWNRYALSQPIAALLIQVWILCFIFMSWVSCGEVTFCWETTFRCFMVLAMAIGVILGYFIGWWLEAIFEVRFGCLLDFKRYLFVTFIFVGYLLVVFLLFIIYFSLLLLSMWLYRWLSLIFCLLSYLSSSRLPSPKVVHCYPQTDRKNRIVFPNGAPLIYSALTCSLPIFYSPILHSFDLAVWCLQLHPHRHHRSVCWWVLHCSPQFIYAQQVGFWLHFRYLPSLDLPLYNYNSASDLNQWWWPIPTLRSKSTRISSKCLRSRLGRSSKPIRSSRGSSSTRSSDATILASCLCAANCRTILVPSASVSGCTCPSRFWLGTWGPFLKSCCRRSFRSWVNLIICTWW